MPATEKDDLLGLSDYVFQRTWTRLEGLTDDEYFWEPAPGCWTLRPRPDGVWRLDGFTTLPSTPAFTTLAWRLCHLIGCYGGDRNPAWLGVEPPPGEEPFAHGAPITARAALDRLQRAFDRWRLTMVAVDNADLRTPLGPIGGEYAEASKAAFIHHQLDEVIHHGAEVDMMRDLYALMHRKADPNLDTVEGAAAFGRWDRVHELVAAGAPFKRDGITTLHAAAGAGELELVRLLVDKGADLGALDPEYQATPLGWAQWFKQQAVADYLAPLTPATAGT